MPSEAELEKEIAALQAKAEGDKDKLTNTQRRKIYANAEELYLKIHDSLPPEKAEPLQKKIDEMEAKFLKIVPVQLSKNPVYRFLQRVDMLVRMISGVSWLCWNSMLFFLPMVTVVTLVDKGLKRVGWPERYLLYELGKKMMAGGFLVISGVFYTVEGRGPKYTTPMLLFFQHGSNLDGFFILTSFTQHFKSIGKKEIFLMPYVGWLAYLYGILPIDRRHRDNAIKQLQRATNAVKAGIPVAFSPEGTRSTTGQLLRFKKGPFYVQADTKSAAVPLVILGNYELWPPNRLFTFPGQCVLHYLPPVPYDTVKDAKDSKEHNEAWNRLVRKQMLDSIDKIVSDPKHKHLLGGPLSWWLRIVNVASIAAFWSAIAFTKKGCDYLIVEKGLLTWPQFWATFVGYSTTVTFLLFRVWARPLA